MKSLLCWGISVDTKQGYLVAWYCQNCGRKEGSPEERRCKTCREKMQRCSRYEWFLYDELERLFRANKSQYSIAQQYPLEDHRGFTWYFDIYIWLSGKSCFNGYGELIEVNGPEHEKQKEYKHGGYTRDYDKEWEVFSNLRMHKHGIEMRKVLNSECARKDGSVYLTARKIYQEILERADTWC